jgi:hypothetical protein
MTADSITPMRTPRLLLDLFTMLLVLSVAATPTVNGRPSWGPAQVVIVRDMTLK